MIDADFSREVLRTSIALLTGVESGGIFLSVLVGSLLVLSSVVALSYNRRLSYTRWTVRWMSLLGGPFGLAFIGPVFVLASWGCGRAPTEGVGSMLRDRE